MHRTGDFLPCRCGARQPQSCLSEARECDGPRASTGVHEHRTLALDVLAGAAGRLGVLNHVGGAHSYERRRISPSPSSALVKNRTARRAKRTPGGSGERGARKLDLQHKWRTECGENARARRANNVRRGRWRTLGGRASGLVKRPLRSVIARQKCQIGPKIGANFAQRKVRQPPQDEPPQ